MRAMYLYIGGSQVYLVLYIRPGLLLYSKEAGMRLGRLWCGRVWDVWRARLSVAVTCGGVGVLRRIGRSDAVVALSTSSKTGGRRM